MQHVASREALRELTEATVGGASLLSDATLRSAGTDLLSVADLLRQQPGLRRTLSEATTSAETRSSLVNGLLSGKIQPAAMQAVVDAVSRQWSSGGDLRHGIENLGRTLLFLAADRAGELDQVEDQLFRFGRIVDANPELSVLLDDPTADVKGRKALVKRLLDDKAHSLTTELLAALASESAGRSFSHGVAELVTQAAERKQELAAQVLSAAPLDDGQHTRLGAALTKLYGRPVAIHVEIDPTLQGGVRITIGDEVIDGSVAGRLAALRRNLAG